jgi:hypothetical protein
MGQTYLDEILQKWATSGSIKKGSFWWKYNLKLLNCYIGLAHATAKRGDSINFSQDMWNGRVLSQSYPHLYYYANNQNISLCSVLEISELEELFYLPLSEEAYEQFCELDIYLQTFQISNEDDQ